MAKRVTVIPNVADSRAYASLRTLKNRFPKSKLTNASSAIAYTIDAKLSASELRAAAAALTNPTIETSTTADSFGPKKFSYAIEIGFLPGVTDNVANTARQTIEDRIGRALKQTEQVYSSVFLFLTGSLSRDEAAMMADELHNSLIERASIYDVKQARRGFPIIVPRVKLGAAPTADIVDLECTEEELIAIGKGGIQNRDGTRRGPLALSLAAMQTIRDHYRSIARNPTDIELESLAQTWSEHCKHSIFADPIDDISEGIYKKYIKGATQRIRKEKGKNDFCVSVFTDNAGAIVFDDEYLVTHKVETHNSPSALDPFGGAITGIVGVNRDALGFGLGAKPIANIYGFCVADPRDGQRLYRDEALSQELLPSRRILEGVIKGINAGGNQSGIPTPLGFVATDPRYRGKPLVFAGTVGLIPRRSKGRKLHQKKAKPGDYVVVVGGRVGLDGIHGATFSSESLSSGSPATAVQIGDPITQKKLSDAIVREARDRGLYSSITDNGAGGISCSVAEMAKECGGARVDLDKVPLKYPGLAPWQIWISESQERMTLAVPKAKWKELKRLFDRHDVEATVIGEFTKKRACIVRYGRKVIMDMDMAFLHDGRPVEMQRTVPVVREHAEPSDISRSAPLDKTLLTLLGRPNIASTAFISEQYDHEVQGSSVTKPLQGKGRVNSDASVLQPVPDSPKGIVLSHGYAPWYSDIDTYAMAAAAIDTAIRNAIAAGASRNMLAILDNFCWSSSHTPERLYELKRSAEAVYDIAVAYGTPYISGKDSMFNDFRGYTERGEKIHIAAPPTLLISAIGVVKQADRATTIDFKAEGDVIYLLGETNDELGGSEYYSSLGSIGTRVPAVNVSRNMRIYDALERAIRQGIVPSAISVGRGGLAVALAKSAIGGQLGADIKVAALPGNAKAVDSMLFSESQGRLLVTVRKSAVQEFEKIMHTVPRARLGFVKGSSLKIRIGRKGIDIPLKQLTASYRNTFKNW